MIFLFTNFKDIFKPDDKDIYKIPKLLLDNLNKELPNGFLYTQVGENLCALTPTEKNIKVKANLKFNNKDKVDIHSPEEAIQYLYRTQQSAEVISNCIELNGQKFKLSDLLIAPLSDPNPKGCKVFVRPAPFPESVELKIGYSNKHITTKFERKPYADLHKSLFESIILNCLTISFLIDEQSDDMEINVSINIGKAKTTSEIIEAANIYKSFKIGNATIESENLTKTLKSSNEEYGLEELINFWSKVHQIGEKLNITFNPKNDILESDIVLVNKLYRCFIEDEAFKETINLESLSVTASEDFDPAKITDNGYFEFQLMQNQSFNLFDAELKNLIEVVYWCNIKIKSVDLIDKEKFRYKFLIDKNSDKKMFRIVKYFKNYELPSAEEFAGKIANTSDSEKNSIKTL